MRSAVSEDTEHLKRVWEKEAPTYDRRMGFFERVLFGDGREWVCSRASGKVLEVAVGTGRNFAFYPQGVRLSGIDLSPAMLEFARKKADELGLDADLREGKVTPGAASVLLQAVRLERDVTREDARESSGDAFIESIQILRASNPPDLSEDNVASANVLPGGIDDMSDEDRRALEADEARDERSRRIRTAPIEELTLEERWERKRRQSGRRKLATPLSGGPTDHAVIRAPAACRLGRRL